MNTKMTKPSDIDLSTVNRSQLSRSVGVDVAHISRILNGRQRPSIDLARRMADVLGVSLDDLERILAQARVCYRSEKDETNTQEASG